jgi:hypothetical protein
LLLVQKQLLVRWPLSLPYFFIFFFSSSSNVPPLNVNKHVGTIQQLKTKRKSSEDTSAAAAAAAAAVAAEKEEKEDTINKKNSSNDDVTISCIELAETGKEVKEENDESISTKFTKNDANDNLNYDSSCRSSSSSNPHLSSTPPKTVSSTLGVIKVNSAAASSRPEAVPTHSSKSSTFEATYREKRLSSKYQRDQKRDQVFLVVWNELKKIGGDYVEDLVDEYEQDDDDELESYIGMVFMFMLILFTLMPYYFFGALFFFFQF